MNIFDRSWNLKIFTLTGRRLCFLCGHAFIYINGRSFSTSNAINLTKLSYKITKIFKYSGDVWPLPPPTCSSEWLRHINSHRGQRQVSELPALSFREGGHAEAPVQLVPLQWLEAWADPAFQPTRGHAACGHHSWDLEDEDEDGSYKKHQEPHCHTLVLLVPYFFFGFPQFQLFSLFLNFLDIVIPPFSVQYFLLFLSSPYSLDNSCFSSWFILFSFFARYHLIIPLFLFFSVSVLHLFVLFLFLYFQIFVRSSLCFPLFLYILFIPWLLTLHSCISIAGPWTFSAPLSLSFLLPFSEKFIKISSFPWFFPADELMSFFSSQMLVYNIFVH